MRFTTLTITFGAIVLLCQNPFAQADGPAAVSIDDITATLRTSFQNVHSLFLSYTINHEVTSDAAPFLSKGTGHYAESDEFAFDGKLLYRRRLYWSVGGDGQRDYWNDERLVTDGSRMLEQMTMTRATEPPVKSPAQFIPFTSDAKFVQNNIYMEAIGSFNYDGRWLDPWVVQAVETPLVKFSLPDCLTADSYTVQHGIEQLEDSACVVVVALGRDKMWLDKDRGFAVVQREWNWHNTNAIMMRFRASRFENRGQATWFPMRATCELFAKPTNKDVVNVRVRTSACDVAKLTINDVPADVFDMSLPRGTDIVDATVVGSNTMVEYRAGTTPEETETNLKESLRRAEFDKPVAASRSRAFWFAMCGMILLLLGAAVLRRWSGSSSH